MRGVITLPPAENAFKDSYELSVGVFRNLSTLPVSLISTYHLRACYKPHQGPLFIHIINIRLSNFILGHELLKLLEVILHYNWIIGLDSLLIEWRAEFSNKLWMASKISRCPVLPNDCIWSLQHFDCLPKVIQSRWEP